MPFARIDLAKGKSPEYRATLADVVYEGIVGVLKAPDGDRFIVVGEHSPENLIYDPNFLGWKRSPDFVLIQVTSTVGTGSTFSVKILLSEVTNPTRTAPIDAPFFGYHGPRKTILITDDDPVHRDLLREVLTPLGFILLSAPDGPGCLALAQHCQPDLFLLDISMAGMDGWTVAETLRSTGHHHARILMVSASALEAHGAPLAQPFHDGYLMKPIDIPRLLELIRQLLKIEWQYESGQVAPPHWKPETGSRPQVRDVEELIDLGQMGYIRAIQLKLEEMAANQPEHADFVAQMRSLIDRFDLDQYMATLKTLYSYDH